MKHTNLYYVYLDDGDTCFKVPVPADNAKAAAAYTAGSGEVIAIKEDKTTVIDPGRVYDLLTSGGMSRYEAEVVMRLVTMSGLDWER